MVDILFSKTAENKNDDNENNELGHYDKNNDNLFDKWMRESADYRQA